MSDFWSSLTSGATSVRDSFWDGASGYVTDWWKSKEDGEAKPQSFQQTAVNEKLAEGSVIPDVETATDADGKTIVTTTAPKTIMGIDEAYTPYLIGGGILLVLVLLIFLLRGK